MIYDKEHLDFIKRFSEMLQSIGYPNSVYAEFIVKCKDTFETENNVIEKDTRLLITGHDVNNKEHPIKAKVMNDDGDAETFNCSMDTIANHFEFVVEETDELYKMHQYNDVINSLQNSIDSRVELISQVTPIMAGIATPVGLFFLVLSIIFKLTNVVFQESYTYTVLFSFSSISTIIGLLSIILYVVSHNKIETTYDSICVLSEYVKDSEKELLLGVYKSNAISISDDILT